MNDRSDGSLLEGRAKEEYVTGMFNRIATPYDRLNNLISMGQDGSWRRAALDWADLSGKEDVCDLGTGTGDFYLAIRERLPSGDQILGIDVAENMLAIAAQKAKRNTAQLVSFV